MDNAKIVDLIQRIDRGDYDETCLYTYTEIQKIKRDSDTSNCRFYLSLGIVLGMGICGILTKILK